MKVMDPASMAQALASGVATASRSGALQPANMAQQLSKGMEPFRRELLNLVQSLQSSGLRSRQATPDPMAAPDGQSAPAQSRQVVPVGGAQSGVGTDAVNNGSNADWGAGEKNGLGAAAQHLVEALADQMGAAGIAGGQHGVDAALRQLVQALTDAKKSGPGAAGGPGGEAGGIADPAKATSGADGGAAGNGAAGLQQPSGPANGALDDAAKHLLQALEQMLQAGNGGGIDQAAEPKQPDQPAAGRPAAGSGALQDALAQLLQALKTELQAGNGASGGAPPDTGTVAQRLAQALQPTPPADAGHAPGSGAGPAPAAGGAAANPSGATPADAAGNAAQAKEAGTSASAQSAGDPSQPSGDFKRTQLTQNAGGVAQAMPINGVNPDSSKVIEAGGTDKVFNVTNNPDRKQSFTYSDRNANKATMTLRPGETQSFRSDSKALGVRVSPSDASGNTHPNEVMDEDGADLKDPNKQNNDVSKVDGDKDFGGRSVDMTVVLGDGGTAGDGFKNHAYAFPDDDAASMALAGDTNKTVNVVMSDKAA